MAKEIAGLIKLQIKGGAANPSPPVGPALGSKGVNIMEFCKQFNARTQDSAGKVIPVIITVYKDKSFDFILKTPPVAVQLMEVSKITKRFTRTEFEKSCFSYVGTSTSDCRKQNERLKLFYCRFSNEYGSRNSKKYGNNR